MVQFKTKSFFNRFLKIEDLVLIKKNTLNKYLIFRIDVKIHNQNWNPHFKQLSSVNMFYKSWHFIWIHTYLLKSSSFKSQFPDPTRVPDNFPWDGADFRRILALLREPKSKRKIISINLCLKQLFCFKIVQT